MKTTLDLNDKLVAEAMALAARQRTTLTRLIEEGLRLRLRAVRGKARREPLPIHSEQGGLAEGVDPLSNASLQGAADRDA